MNFMELPTYCITLIMGIGSFIFGGMFFLLMLQVMERRINWRHVVTAVLILIYSAAFIFLRFIVANRKDAALMLTYDVVPWPMYVILEAFMAGYTIIALNNEIRFEYKQFRKSNVREAIDNLPNGLCFSDQYGQPVLMNYNMVEYAQKICGYRLKNADTFWRDLLEKEPAAGVRRLKTKKPMPNQLTFVLPDGSVLQVGRKQLFIPHLGPYIQTTISDVTMLHELYHQAEENNEKLRVQRREIRELTDRMIRTNHEEEVLAHKIRIHNEMGQMILPTRQMLLGHATLTEYKSIGKQWKQIAEKFGEIAGQEAGNARELLQEIFDIAEQIGCEVHMKEDLPASLVSDAWIRQAIREGIINAVRHGMATQIWLSMETNGDAYTLHLMNDGVLPKGEFEMRGGLKNLSEALRAKGGTIQIHTTDKFELVIHVPKNMLKGE